MSAARTVRRDARQGRQRRSAAAIAVACALALAALLALAGCGRSYGRAGEARADYARRGEGSILVAVVVDGEERGYLDGLRLALRRINGEEGGVLGRALELQVRPGGARFAEVRRTVRAIAKNPRTVAVLGHRRSEVALPASVIYQAARVLFLPPFATDERLTLHDFDMVLRMLPSNKDMAAQAASVAALFGYRRLAVLHSRDDYSRGLAFLFEDAARREGLGVVYRGSFFADEPNYRGLLGELAGVRFDALYLSTETQAGARLLQQMRELNLAQPVLGSDRLNEGPLAATAGPAGERTIVPTVWSADDPSERNRRFVADFTAAYGRPPDQDAAQGYDSLGLLAEIVARAGSTEPDVLATAAHYSPPWPGVTGIFAFDPRGNLYGKSFRFQVLRFGRWHHLPGVTAPYLLGRFEGMQQEVAAERATAGGGVSAGPAAGTVGAAAPDPAGGGAACAPAPGPAAAAAPTPTGTAAVGESAADRPAAGAAAPEPLGLAALYDPGLDRTARIRIWLALAHRMLGFSRLGLVLSPGGSGDGALGLAREVGERAGFTVEACALAVPDAAAAAPVASGDGSRGQPLSATREAAPGATQAELERAALACWSRLATRIDALMLGPDTGLEPERLRRLNRALRHYRVAVFALADELDADYGLTLALLRSGLNLDDAGVVYRFGGLLNGMRVWELNRKLQALPTVALDLAALATLGMRLDPRELAVVSRVLEPGDLQDPAAGEPAHAPSPHRASADAPSPPSTAPETQLAPPESEP